MLKRIIAVGIAIAVVGSAVAQKVTFSRTYTLGDKDVYAMTMEMNGRVAMTMSMTSTQEVTKVYDDGSADVKVTTSDMKMNMGGREITIPARGQAQAVTMHLSKTGAATDIKGNTNGTTSMQMIYGGMTAFKDGIEVGQTVPFDASDKKHPSIHSKGTFTLVSVSDGVATIHIVADVTDATGKAGGHTDGTYLIVTATSKLSKADMTTTNAAIPGGGSVHITMTRQTT
ncbi:MAG: hypothetical protein ACYC96_05830 [Fimbriimonadaceae bacterium]